MRASATAEPQSIVEEELPASGHWWATPCAAHGNLSISSGRSQPPVSGIGLPNCIVVPIPVPCAARCTNRTTPGAPRRRWRQGSHAQPPYHTRAKPWAKGTHSKYLRNFRIAAWKPACRSGCAGARAMATAMLQVSRRYLSFRLGHRRSRASTGAKGDRKSNHPSPDIVPAATLKTRILRAQPRPLGFTWS